MDILRSLCYTTFVSAVSVAYLIAIYFITITAVLAVFFFEFFHANHCNIIYYMLLYKRRKKLVISFLTGRLLCKKRFFPQ